MCFVDVLVSNCRYKVPSITGPDFSIDNPQVPEQNTYNVFNDIFVL